MNSTSSGKNSGSSRVLTEMLQNTPLMRDSGPSRRSVCTLFTSSTLSIRGIMPDASAGGRYDPGRISAVGLGSDAGERLEIAGPPLGQRDGRLQIQIDPPGLDGLADDLEHLVVADAGRCRRQ